MENPKLSDELSAIILNNKLEDELDELRGGRVNDLPESSLVSEIGIEAVD